ncbi:cysteine hydrolase family protein [Pararhizobium sp. O133]|uniref:cysteine hydrolase family protein n=1 Tax=Pararhizobium sp. O133 TaxID=3449278 RepID=UPI003F6891C2
MRALGNWRHLCVDMQRLFAEDTPWHVDWMNIVLPQVEEVAGHFPEATIFTRFIPPEHASDMNGTWRDYYTKWWMLTREHLPDGFIDLVPSLSRLVPPAKVFDKRTYSPWTEGNLDGALKSAGIETLVISGGETDVCVLAAVLGAIDLGYHVVLLSDGVCSGTDGTHDASLALLGNRFSVQLDLCTTEEFLRAATS